MLYTKSNSSPYPTHNNNINNSYNSGLISANTNANGIVGYDNPSRYSTSYGANSRTNVYYDTSVISEYDQPYTTKPAVIGHSQGKTSDFMLYGSSSTFNYDSSIWYFKDKSGDNAYYPQLRIFATNTYSRIVDKSEESVEIDVSGGLGTATVPFLIKNEEDMHELSRMVLLGNVYKNYYFKVDDGVTELDLGDFIPIGTSARPFQGNFNGNGVNFIVDINKATTDNVGVFGYINGSAVIENFSVSGSVIGRNNVGAILGQTDTAIVRNVYNTAYVQGGTGVGGLIGNHYRGTLQNSFNLGEVKGSQYVGGIVGRTMLYTRSNSSPYPTHNNNINNVYSAAQVSVAGSNTVGGAIGFDNTSRYSTSYAANTRTNIYYDSTIIANHDQSSGYSKPSSLQTTLYALNTGELMLKMSGKLSAAWYLKDKDDTYGYYPQLTIFSNHVETEVKELSEENVKFDVSLGMGTEDLPFIIKTNEDIDELRRKVADGNTFQGYFFVVDPSVEKFELGTYTPIGASASRPFYGSFDGSHAEFNITIDATTNNQGLFGYFGVGTIKNLSVTGSVKGGTYVGGVVGYKVSGTVSGVYNLAKITGVSQVGGVVGRNEAGTITQSYNNRDVFASTSYAGGITGYLYTGTISNTYNRAEILTPSHAGGIAGGSMLYTRSNSSPYPTHNNNINNSYNSGLISANTNANGIVGYDNPSRYSTSYRANPRTNIFYDTSVISEYDQPYTTKPAVIGHAHGKTSDFMLYGSSSTFNYDSSIWYFKDKSGDNAYYPQLRIFATNTYSRIVSKSEESVEIDVSGGLGTATVPFLIKNEEDMHELSRMVLLGNVYKNYYFKVDDGVTELDLGDFIPVGTSARPFQGNFNGNGVNFIVDINKATTDNIGIFGYINNSAVIENFSVSGSVIGRNNVGGILGYTDIGTVRNVYNTAYIQGGTGVGGLIGNHYRGTLQNSFNLGEVKGSQYVGGIVGRTMLYTRSNSNPYPTHNNNINNVYSAAPVSVAGSNTVGGAIGFDNTSRYSTSYAANTRTNIYYDSTIIANHDQSSGYSKPSSLQTTLYALNTGELMLKMSGKLSAAWYLKDKDDTYGYYPQLTIFSNHVETEVKELSEENVKVDVSLGMGTEDLPFIIKTNEDIDELRRKVADGNTFQGYFFVVDPSVEKFELGTYTPIGASASRPFYGSFDGSHAEFNITIDATTNNQGLFGYFGVGTIKNLSVTGSVKGGTYVGGVVGYKVSGTVSGVYNLAKITGVSQVGGVVGRNEAGTITQSYNNGDVFASTSYAGGITGYLYTGTISNTYNRAEILTPSHAGGIAGGSMLYTRSNSSPYPTHNK